MESQGYSSTRRIRTVCPVCSEQDGVVCTVENGRITEIVGDKEHPISKGYTCIKGRRALETVYRPQRYKQPLLRVGSNLKQITWEEAIDIAADRLGEVKNRFGPYSFCASHCHTYNVDSTALSLFTLSMGSPNQISPGDICMGTQHVADWATTGYGLSTHSNTRDFRNSKCILLVGTNMVASSGGRWQNVLYAKRNGAKVIVVDPRRSETAKAADIYLQVRPGSDGALGLAMLHVIINERLYDADFVNTYCLGFEELSEHVQQYTPDKVADITWLPSEEIVRVARTFATSRPAAYGGDSGISHHTNSTQSARAFSILTAITGNIDVPGGNLIDVPDTSVFRFLQSCRLCREAEEQRLGAKRFPLWSGPESRHPVAHTPSIINAIITSEPYPVKSMVTTSNHLVSFPDTRKLIEALKKLELLMLIAHTPSPMSEFADLILPTTHPFEYCAIRYSRHDGWVSFMPKLIEPPEGVLDGMQILYRLSEAMVQKGYIQKHFIPWRDANEFTGWRLRNLGTRFKDLPELGTMIIDRQYKKYTEQGFPTPSGKVELYSALLERHGYDPLPTFRERVDGPLMMRRLAKNYPLQLVTRRHPKNAHGRSAGEEWFRKSEPYPRVQIHPSTAQERGIRQDDMIVVETPRGTFQHLADLTEDIHPLVVSGVFGWWLPERDTPDKGCLEVNINAAMSYDAPYDPVVGINSVQGVMCQVYRASVNSQQRP